MGARRAILPAGRRERRPGPPAERTAGAKEGPERADVRRREAAGSGPARALSGLRRLRSGSISPDPAQRAPFRRLRSVLWPDLPLSVAGPPPSQTHPPPHTDSRPRTRAFRRCTRLLFFFRWLPGLQVYWFDLVASCANVQDCGFPGLGVGRIACCSPRPLPRTRGSI